MSDFFFLPETCFHLNFSPTSLKFIVCIQVTWPNIISYRGLPGAFCKFYFPDNKQQQKSPPPLSAFMPWMLTTKRLARWKAASAASDASSFRKPRTMKYNPCIAFPANIPPFQLVFTIVLIHWLKPPDQNGETSSQVQQPHSKVKHWRTFPVTNPEYEYFLSLFLWWPQQQQQ